ncbi:DUF2931 family protein, partial [Billgrantia desiderata]|uniref:DUF2931 family protein n=1 Tax=Billgrantia desiderata TaxID=52021 RepID=UPI003F3D70D0
SGLLPDKPATRENRLPEVVRNRPLRLEFAALSASAAQRRIVQRFPNGDLLEGFDQQPPYSGTYSFGAPLPAPQTMQARWFSYRTQTFYEIDLALPDMLESLPQWYRDYPLSRFHHALTVGLSGHGEVQVGWHAWCRNCADRSEDFYAPIVSTARGEEAVGATERYRTRTQAFIDQGIFPSPW